MLTPGRYFGEEAQEDDGEPFEDKMKSLAAQWREQQTEVLLRQHLPSVEVWAYGSRVSGRSHEGSDLDLVLRGSGLAKIDLSRLADFEEALRDSSIPFLVEARD